MASSGNSRQNEDLLSNVPDIITDKILELLPIQMAARTSLLSKQWRNNWLSLKRLVFDQTFYQEHCDENGICDWKECSKIIDSILSHHHSTIHDFELHIPTGANEEACLNLGEWLCFLSKNGVKRIILDNWSEQMNIPSYIFWCSELVQLQLDYFVLNQFPANFNGFPKLKNLVLKSIQFAHQNVFGSLMAKCCILSTLSLVQWNGMDNLIIDIPSLENLTISGEFQSIDFRDVRNLKSISVSLFEMPMKPFTMETVDAGKLQAALCQLQCIEFTDDFCKFLVAGGITRCHPVTFNHLNKLSLHHFDFGEFGIVKYVYCMIESCPNLKELTIEVLPAEYTTEDEIDCNKNHKLDHLHEVKIKGITGTSTELKLVEYLLAIPSGLEKLSFACGRIDTELELKLLRALTELPRASPNARFICLIWSYLKQT